MTRMRHSPPASTPEIARQLEAVAALWEPFKVSLRAVARSNGMDAAAASAVMSANVELRR